VKVGAEYRIDVLQVSVGSHPLQAILITKFVNREGSIRCTANGEVVAVISLLTHREVPDRVLRDGGIAVISFHQVGKFRESILCDELRRGKKKRRKEKLATRSDTRPQRCELDFTDTHSPFELTG